jgi:ADP-heptose:LPS heptosyltransferase
MGRWQKQLLQTAWTSMIQLWKLRITERHGWDAESKESARREVLHKELEAIYDQKQQYPRRVQRLLRASYEIHIQESATKLADWLDAYKGTFAVTWAPD